MASRIRTIRKLGGLPRQLRFAASFELSGGHRNAERIILMLANAYKVVMDPSVNPLRDLPRMVSFHYMLLLSYMWSAIFALWIGYTWLMGPSLIAHSILLVGLFFTAEIFALANRRAQPAVVGAANDNH
jgi:hypothetical protein